MPMKHDPLGGGTEADGAKNPEYCSYCFANGAFIQPDISCKEMIAQVKAIMWQKFKIPAFLSWFFVWKIPKLKRWNSSGIRGN
ncbi:MAG: hypothetical protein EXR99_15875 [Gemmataceae bacterium]|nr:hypothetical protein [Gemmataceae bacterium]